MGKFLKFLLVVALFAGCFYLYQNQEKLLDDAISIFKKEKTIQKVNNASATKQKYMEDAQRQLYGE